LYDGVLSLSSSSHTRSELEMHCGEAVTLFLSFSILLFSLSLYLCGYIYFSFFFFVYILVKHSWLLKYNPYISRPGRTFFLFFLLTVYIKRKNSCLSCSTIGCNLTTSSDDEKEKEKSLFFPLDLSPFSSLVCVCVAQCLRVVYAVHDNDVKSAQKISLDCMLHRMNKSSRLSITHAL